jgi:hypothetical protein
LCSVKSVDVSEPKKALTVAVPQVAPPTNSAVGAPGGEALFAMPAEPATLPVVSSREASPPIGAFPMQFKQLGDDEAYAIEDRNVRLTALGSGRGGP